LAFHRLAYSFSAVEHRAALRHHRHVAEIGMPIGGHKIDLIEL
jgi:hypothetical protein